MSEATIRATKQITTPSGKIAEIKTYLTNRERIEIKKVFSKYMTVDPSSETPEVKEISGMAMIEAENKLMEVVLVSFDGDTAKPYEKLMDAMAEDYDCILKEIGGLKNLTNFQPAK